MRYSLSIKGKEVVSKVNFVIFTVNKNRYIYFNIYMSTVEPYIMCPSACVTMGPLADWQ